MKGKSKRLYNKPQINKVSLLPEEAVLLACKTVSGTDRSDGKCRSGGTRTCQNKTPGS